MTDEVLAANANLYAKMEESFQDFSNWLLKQQPEEILNHAYEYVIKENILLDMDGKGKSQQIADGAIVAKSDRPSVLDKLKTPAIHGCQGKTHNLNKEER